MSNKINLAVVFGSRSVEHEVSIVTALQIIENADKEKYNVIPVYIDKSGKWFSGKALLDINNYKNIPKLLEKGVNLGHKPIIPFLHKELKIDIFFPAIHGTFGEDGTLQGLLEMSAIPYVGSGVTGSAIGMDKVMQKCILKQNGINVADFLLLLREDWRNDPKAFISRFEKEIGYPAVVKPANLGSSVGIKKVVDREELKDAIDLAAQFDRRIIVEDCLENVIEINCSVLGYKNLEASICEQPIKSADLLSYEDKYLKGSKTKGMASLSRLIPAPISPKLTNMVQETARQVFRLLDASGVARIDFFVDVKSEKIWVCEINTLPGSISFYLWEKSGYPFPKLIDKLVELAMERFNDRKQTQYSFSSNLLQTLGSKSSDLAGRSQKV